MASEDLTPKQLKFCEKYIELGNASEAYRQSYDAENMLDKTVWEEASRTLADHKVAARIMELQEIHRLRHEVTVSSITAELDESRQLATADKQHSAAITASMGKAKLHGLIVDRNEHSGPGGTPIKTEITVTSEAVKAIIQQVRDEF
jgi:phage terminase small subunit